MLYQWWFIRILLNFKKLSENSWIPPQEAKTLWIHCILSYLSSPEGPGKGPRPGPRGPQKRNEFLGFSQHCENPRISQAFYIPVGVPKSLIEICGIQKSLIGILGSPRECKNAVSSWGFRNVAKNLGIHSIFTLPWESQNPVGASPEAPKCYVSLCFPLGRRVPHVLSIFGEFHQISLNLGKITNFSPNFTKFGEISQNLVKFPIFY